MAAQYIILAFLCFLVISFLYSTVGHAGASGYLALMALLSFPLISIKPTSLALNIIVSAIGTYKYIKADCFDKKVFIAFSITSIPLAFVGGFIKLESEWFKLLTGIFLIVSAVFLLTRRYSNVEVTTKEVNIPVALVIGGAIGLVSGLIGVGGGIFLSPIIIALGYTTVRNASGIAALFILCNSTFGLIGNYASLKYLDANAFYWIVAVVIGGYIGSHFGARKLNTTAILVFLFLVLMTAGLKFIFIG